MLKSSEISNNGVIQAAYRGQIASFGASVMNGSLLASIVFFSDQSGAKVDRNLLMDAIFEILNKVIDFTKLKVQPKTLFDYVKDHNTKETKELVLEASVALKLAMNLFVLAGDETTDDKEAVE